MYKKKKNKTNKLLFKNEEGEEIDPKSLNIVSRIDKSYNLSTKITAQQLAIIEPALRKNP